VGLELRVIDCLLFGAIISPTDPIAVIGILKTAGAPKSLETKIAGESLFNDGIGVVVFVVLLGVAQGTEAATPGHVGLLLLKEAVGGAVFGLVLGLVAFRMLWRVNSYPVEVLITLATASGGYALAHALHVSGPIAVVVAGLLVGNHGRAYAMSPETRQHVDTFWELVDEVLNALLFLLVGLEVLVMQFTWRYLLAALAIIPVALLVRWACVAGTVTAMRRFRPFTPGAITIMTWSGLRGGISVALALSLPQHLGDPAGGHADNIHLPRNVILAVTYAVVVFSIIVQGLTVGPLVWRMMLRGGGTAKQDKETRRGGDKEKRRGHRPAAWGE
jgi:CPA1 family monovalent cation:H+ antiporter